MKRLLTRILPVFLLLLFFTGAESVAQTGKSAKKYGVGNLSKSGFKKKAPAIKSSETKVREPKAVVKAKKEQEKKQKKLQKENDKAVASGNSRHFEIQPASVKERMKQNEKDNALRDKNRKKNIKKASKPAARKYKK
jgi:hypothetical protein